LGHLFAVSIARAREVSVESPVSDPILSRVDEQIGWYSRSSSKHRRSYQSLKLVTIVSAGAIPVLALLGGSALATAILGSVILGIEGIQQLFQNQRQWIAYRLAAEDLKRERSLFMAHAGPYRTAKDARARYVERTEARIAVESGGWRQIQEDNASTAEGETT
jgi:uncharacterized protein DUF4231